MHRRTALPLLLAVLLVAPWSGLARPVRAAGFVVNSTADEPDATPGDALCVSTPTGVCTLRAAIMEANALAGPDTISVPAGAFELTRVLSPMGPDEDTGDSDDLDILDSVTVTGSGVGTTTISKTNPLVYHRIVDVANLPITVTLVGLTISGGFSSFPGSTIQPGGGILNRGATLNLRNVALTNNTAGASGGGLANAGTADLLDVVVSENAVGFGNFGSAGGGGISNTGTLTGRRVVVRANHATFGNSPDMVVGTGGVENMGQLILTDSSIIDNQSASQGGGLSSFGAANATLDRVLVAGNAALSTNASFRPGVGGGIYASGPLTLLNSTVSGNSAGVGGGAIYVTGASAVVGLTNTTLAANTAPSPGRTLINRNGTLRLLNTIVSHDAGSNCDGPITSQGHNIASDLTCGLTGPADRADTAPLLGPLADNGGPTLTHALQIGSPATDGGDDSACPSVDQRSRPRPVDGNADGIASCDVGAFERQDPDRFGLTIAKAGTGFGTVTSDPAGIVCGSDCQEAYLIGQQVTLTATPAQGNDRSTFAGWSGACTGTGPCQVTLDAAKSVTATFTRETVGVQVGRPSAPPPGTDPSLTARLSARASCGTIERIELGEVGRTFDNAIVTIVSPAGGPAGQGSGFVYTPPPGTTEVSFIIQRAVQTGGATVRPIRLRDGCGEWLTFVGGGPNAW